MDEEVKRGTWAGKPLHQRLVLAIVWLLVGFLALGNMLGAVSNALSVVTWAVSWVGSVLLFLSWGTAAAWLRCCGIYWTDAHSQRVKLRRLSPKMHFVFLGCLALLWAPRVIEHFRGVADQTKGTIERPQVAPALPRIELEQPPGTLQRSPQPKAQHSPTPLNWREQARRDAFTFTLFDVVPDAAMATSPAAINDNGDVIGTYTIDRTSRSFLRLADGTLLQIRHPETGTADGFTLSGLNNRREIVGTFVDATKKGRHGSWTHGFVRRADGTFEPFDCLGSSYTRAAGINDHGQVVGNALDAIGAMQGFLRERDGTCMPLNHPGASGTGPTGINNQGEIIGLWHQPRVGDRGFLRLRNGEFVSIQPDPAAAVHPRAINEDGVVVGQVGSGGFLRRQDGTYLPLDHPQCPGEPCTIPLGINKQGQIVGQFQVGSIVYGFAATLKPEK